MVEINTNFFVDDPNRPLTREDFISSMTLELATNLPVMYVLSEGQEGMSKIPTPSSVRENGKLPDGYTIGEFQKISPTAPTHYNSQS